VGEHFSLDGCWEGYQGTAMVANRTGEIPPSGMMRGASGNTAMVEL